jgi:hypothetical protein
MFGLANVKRQVTTSGGVTLTNMDKLPTGSSVQIFFTRDLPREIDPSASPQDVRSTEHPEENVGLFTVKYGRFPFSRFRGVCMADYLAERK